MTIINTTPDRTIQLGYEGEDRVTVLRFRYGAVWLENGEGIFHIRVRRHGEHTAYNAALVADDAENNCLLMTVTNVELSVKGTGEMQVVYSGEDFVKKSPIYSYNVSRAVDEAVDPPAEDVYTQIIESLSDLQMDVQGLTDVIEDIGDISLLTTTAKTDLVSAINEVNNKSVDITVDDALSATSENPVQNKAITRSIRELSGYAHDLSGVIDGLGEDVEGLETAIQGKADIQTVSALADAVNGLDSDVQGLQTTVQSKADTATVTALSGTVSSLRDDVVGLQTRKVDFADFDDLSSSVTNLQNVAQQYMEHTEAALDDKADVSAFNDLSGTVSGLQTSKADKSYVDTELAGKASTQTVSDLADDVSDLQTGLAGKVGDVQINGTSVVSNGAAKITVGVGLSFVGNTIKANTASENAIKGGSIGEMLLNPTRQHYSAFYGLAKAAGHDEKNSTLPVGQYTDEAKIAIQKMLGIYEAPWELIEDFTLAEAGMPDKMTEPDGTPYNFRQVFVKVIYPANLESVPSGYGLYYFYDENNNNLLAETGKYTQNTAQMFKHIFLQKNANMTTLMYTRITSVGSYAMLYNKSQGVEVTFGNVSRIRVNGTEPAGTQIQIYAQRAY